MNRRLIRHFAFAASFGISLNVAAESLADQLNEQGRIKARHATHHLGDQQTTMPHSGQVSASSHTGSEPKLTYTAGSALKDYPHLTAHQRKKILFGSN